MKGATAKDPLGNANGKSWLSVTKEMMRVHSVLSTASSRYVVGVKEGSMGSCIVSLLHQRLEDSSRISSLYFLSC